MNIECIERDGKVHSIKSVLDDGTNIMVCGLAQQTPFKSSKAKTCCYGRWQETKKAVTCKKCKSKKMPNDVIVHLGGLNLKVMYPIDGWTVVDEFPGPREAIWLPSRSL